MKVYVVQYHSNAWGDQMVSDVILGVYSSEEKANARAEEFEKSGDVCDDDILSVVAYELDKKSLTMYETWREEINGKKE